MADIRPFRAFRPNTNIVKKKAALPYDVFSREEAFEAVKNNPDSFLAIDRPETGFPKDYDMYAPEVYEKARDMLKKQMEDGSFIQDEEKCFYIYEQVFKERSQTGIVACASIDDYLGGIIKKHENTRADKEEDRIKHVYTCDAQTGPIFLCYRKNRLISELVSKVKEVDEPVYDFESEDGVHNKVWVISDEDEVNTISRIFTSINSIYIADGHHRCASAVKVGLKKREENEGKIRGKLKSDYFLSVLFPDDELEIMDYNRIVKDLNGLSVSDFLKTVSEKFDIDRENEAVKPDHKGQFGMYLDGVWYRLEAKDSVKKDDAVEGLDVSVLQNEILSKVLGIDDPKTDKRIDFIGGIRGLSEIERRCQNGYAVGFSMYPTSIGELFRVADSGRLMPPKSTWFEPKLLSGLFIHDICGTII
ncbi:MAG: DUF1015 domain-containing protein [Butyrivibrio sp.]|uniref:DUF1015 domain-containing protein n=1 Tax=Butyrivibrio sp. TaxID=28121 RepID=UPI001B12C6C0|nr:DUF1015 family protein [Butyrivibrio sp.]MBO6242464.1 DUF1015 domain-containing protein [Butyrivibrio sp.]